MFGLKTNSILTSTSKVYQKHYSLFPMGHIYTELMLEDSSLVILYKKARQKQFIPFFSKSFGNKLR